jgi:hypothetical protein
MENRVFLKENKNVEKKMKKKWEKVVNCGRKFLLLNHQTTDSEYHYFFY